jgi:hypothetical protein
MVTLDTVLLILALVAFVLSACGVIARVNLVAIGLALATLAFLVRGYVR